MANGNELVAAEQAVEKITEVAKDLIADANSRASTLKFPDAGSFVEADNAYNELHRIWKSGEEQRLGFTAPLNEVLRKINAVFKTRLDPIDNVKKILKRAMDGYATAEMIWKRQEDARIAAEKRKADEEALAAATKLAEEGKPKEADAVIAQAIAEKPKFSVGATDTAQSFTKTVWKAEIVDVRAFLHAVADTPNFIHFYTIEQGELNRYAQITKGTAKIPGVEFKEVAAIGARR